MEKNGVLEITNSFPFPEVSAAQTDGQNETVANLAAGAPRAKQNIAYGNEMIKFLREVNVDANNVGWYTSTSMGNFVNLNTIENQFYYQSQPNERTVALIYDVSRSSQGTLNLRAYRLSPSFVTAYKEGKFTTERYVQPISCQGRKLTISVSRRVVSDTTTSWLSSQLPFATPISSPRSYTSYLPMRPRKSSSSHPT
jgi:translation initiation factor 3 subunit H